MADPLYNTNKLLNAKALETAAGSSAAVSPVSLPSSINSIADALDKSARTALEITIDHRIPRAMCGIAPELLVDPENLRFVTRWDNSVKSVWQEGDAVSHPPQSLAGARHEGRFSSAAQAMLDRPFSETEELKALWNQASDGGQRSYEEAQRRFWNLVAEGKDEVARLVRGAFDEAHIRQVPDTGRFAIDPQTLGLTGLGRSVERGFDAIRESLDTVAKSAARGVKSFGPGVLSGIATSATVDALKEEDRILRAPEPAPAQVDWMDSRGYKYDRVDRKWYYEPSLVEGLQSVFRWFSINTDPSALTDIQRYVEQRNRALGIDPMMI